MKQNNMYPFFLDCLPLCKDSFWKQIFEELSKGIPPINTFIKNDYLCCKLKNKNFSYRIEQKSPQILYKKIKNILTNQVGLLSTADRKYKRNIFNNNIKCNDKYKNKWGNIKKKITKELLLEKYTLTIKRKHNLTLDVTRDILIYLYILLVFKHIKNNNITYENFKIVNINNFNYKERKIPYHNSSKKIKQISNKKSISTEWDRYIDNLKKIC